MKSSVKGARYSPFEQNKNILENEYKEFCTRLADFPNSFHLRDQEILRPTTIERLRKGLECALKAGYSTSLERARARNLLAFTLFRQGASTQALLELELALQEDGESQNIVSMANKAVILWKTGFYYQANCQADLLDDLKREKEEFEYLAIKAKAELAFSYTRLENSHFPIAVSLFQEIIPKAREPEKWLWTFGLALTLRRQIHFQLVLSADAEASNTQRSLLILHLFQEVINNSQSLQAKAYAEIGVLLNSNRDNQTVLDEAGMDAVGACNKALKLDIEDNSVLCKCSKIFRYFREDLDRCCQLLERAISKRPSSTAYHHLGLTYKAMATNLKRPPRGATKHKRKQKKSRPSRSIHKSVLDSPIYYEHSRATTPANHYVQMLRKMVKSPKATTKFLRRDKYVSEAMENLQNAITFSERENKRAMYDLALMYKALGEYREALALLGEMRASEDTLPIDRVNAFEQSGLIFLSRIKAEISVKERTILQKDADSMLNIALSLASRYFSNIPQFQNHIGEIWHSFSTLDKGLDHSDLTEESIHMEKARLLQVIRKPQESMVFLQALEKMSPAAVQDPKYIKMLVECYKAENDFEHAATLISLRSEQIRKEVKELFKDKQCLLKLYYEAGRQVLLQNSEKVSLAQEYFLFAFEETFKNSLEPVSSSSEDTDDSDSSSHRDFEMNHVMFIHDYQTKIEITNARKLACLVRHVCGLRTSWSNEDYTPGIEMNDALRQIKRSHLVVVIAGNNKLSSEFRTCITNAVQSRPTVTLLVGGTHVPKALKGFPVMQCPQVILDLDHEDFGMQTVDRVDAVCNVFRFLVGIEIDRQ